MLAIRRFARGERRVRAADRRQGRRRRASIPGRGNRRTRWCRWAADPIIEIIAPQADAPQLFADYEPMRTLDRLTIFTWAVGCQRRDGGRRGAEEPPVSQRTRRRRGARVTPAGERLEWSTFGLADRSDRDFAPFFIQWSSGTKASVDDVAGEDARCRR
jgi:hypothetical protein